jgi:deoxyribose-phosphate aldolase
MMQPHALARTIDHTLLKAEATGEQVANVVGEALQHQFASVCVNGLHLSAVVKQLQTQDTSAGHVVKSCGVVGFPLGAMKPAIKAIEATAMAKDGADEIDFVAHLPHLLNEDLDATRDDFLNVTTAVREVRSAIVVKVILETAALIAGVDDAVGERRIALACQAAAESGCDFVKTSTGFHPAGGATVQAVRWLVKHAPNLQVKASGGIRSRDDAIQMLNAGAHRLGCSAGVAIVKGGEGSAGY